MSYHYSRDPGEQGTIHTVDGTAPGVDLATLLQNGRPPLRACLQIGSAIADILTIAEEDRAVHGDIKPGDVTVLANGAVAVDGYGYSRRSTRAPEGRPDGSLTDVFGLGVVMHSLLSDESLGMLPRDPDAHDDAVVDRVMEMDFGDLEGKRWLDDGRRFLCTIMAYDPQERPAPLDAANVLARIAEQAPGTDLETWASQTLRQRGAPEAPPAADPQEALGGPRSLGAPLATGQALESRQAPASKGQTTQMWTRERLAAFIEEDDADESNWDLPGPTPVAKPQEQLPGPSPARPISGGWGESPPSAGWDPAEPPRRPQPWEQEPGTRPHTGRNGDALPGLEPPPLGQDGFEAAQPSAPPRPSPTALPQRPPQRRTPPQGPPPPPPQGRPTPPQGPPPPPPQARPPAPPPAPPRRPAAAPPASTPKGRPPAGRQPGRATSAAEAEGPPPIAWSPEEEAADEKEQKKSSPLRYVLIAVAVLFVLCLGMVSISGAVYYFTMDSTERGAPIVQATDEDPTKRGRTPVEADTASGADKPEPLPVEEPEPEPEPKEPTPVRSTTGSSSGSTSSGSSGSRTGGSTGSGSSSSGSSGSGSSSSGSSSSGSSGSGSFGSGSSGSGSRDSTPAPSTTPEPEPDAIVLPGAGYEVKISLPSKKKASIRCGDGQSTKFSSAVRMDFKGTVTCVVEADGARGAVTVSSGGRVSCGITGEDIFCSGPS